MNFSKVNSDNCNNLLSDKYPDLYQHRFCDQEHFSIVICGGENDNTNICYDRPFLLKNFETKMYLSKFLLPNLGIISVSNGSELYVVDHCEVKRYSFSSKIWNRLSGSPYCNGCCICCFMQKLHVIAGKSPVYDKIINCAI